MASTIEAGASGEDLATRALAARGYRIVERNFRCKLGELDIVACHGDVLCFVEVRSRANHHHGHAAEMVTRGKQRKVSRVAQAYLSSRQPRFARARFDVVAITGDRVEVIQDAWRL
jgi:putative endonuclease